ncbi:GTP pyrophosphokinase [Cellulomonas chengniuliangii]|uniref:GTP pyrophosphokinase n=1 Tax=Cellulomonas chengniuliangii TaxID=2968084 RepID=UPI001D0F1B2B|nr:hypothetical protein [Cellulomonas chengniuliangii]MCC2318384.1 hypothetical protein [Cellulomonas chengniuliangii]
MEDPDIIDAELPFAYHQFIEWYRNLESSHLEPARLAFERILLDEIERIEIEFGRGRFRRPLGRIKDPLRLWAKMTRPKYSQRITGLDTIPQVIDDLVGIRIVCTNKSDLEALRATLDQFDRSETSKSYGIAIENSSERDYLANPKESGYRAYHANIITPVAHRTGTVLVRGELQVRTLLQDGWGELTHEDTYKPGQDLPGIVEVLALRMGQLLATVDDIAQDIQAELGRVSQAAVLDDESEDTPTADIPDDSEEISSELVLGRAAEIVHDQARPVALAVIANLLRGTFGGHALQGWLGFGTFKEFLGEAVPGIQIIPIGPSWAIPPGARPDDTWPEFLREALETPAAPVADEADG